MEVRLRSLPEWRNERGPEKKLPLSFCFISFIVFHYVSLLFYVDLVLL